MNSVKETNQQPTKKKQVKNSINMYLLKPLEFPHKN